MRSRALLLGSLFVVLAIVRLQAAGQVITVFKTATCGCCKTWIEHLKKAGFQVSFKDVPSTAEYQQRYGVPEKLQSCHTAIVEGYTIEGHVPASEIQRLLKERPKAKGLSVPGMPMGSPGMEAGGHSDGFQVLLFQEDGRTSVYKEYPAK